VKNGKMPDNHEHKKGKKFDLVWYTVLQQKPRAEFDEQGYEPIVYFLAKNKLLLLKK
jgi:hypothetical protein